MSEKSKQDREALGQIVREAWREWASQQPGYRRRAPKPWEDLPEIDREEYRQIGEAVAARVEWRARLSALDACAYLADEAAKAPTMTDAAQIAIGIRGLAIRGAS